MRVEVETLKLSLDATTHYLLYFKGEFGGRSLHDLGCLYSLSGADLVTQRLVEDHSENTRLALDLIEGLVTLPSAGIGSSLPASLQQLALYWYIPFTQSPTHKPIPVLTFQP